MPANSTLPTEEQLKMWKARWKDARVEQLWAVISDPTWTTDDLNRLAWYRQPEFNVRDLEHWLWTQFIEKSALDLRGFSYPNANPRTKSAQLVAPQADAQGAELWFAKLSDANLISASFNGAVLAKTVFRRPNLALTDFQNSDLSFASFHEAFLKNARLINANVEGTRFVDCSLEGIKLRSNSGYARLSGSTEFGRSWSYAWWCPLLRRIVAALKLRESSPLHRLSTHQRARPNQWIFDPRDATEDRDACRERVDSCSEIRLCFKDNGLFHEAAVYYEQEEFWRTRHMWLTQRRWTAVMRWLFAEKLMGYGERPSRIIGWSAIAIWLFSVIYYLFGIKTELSDGNFTAPYFGHSEHLFSYSAFNHYLKSLQFSIENFTTLGFSVIKPTEGISHWFATIEGLVGVLMISLATVTFVRKAIRD